MAAATEGILGDSVWNRLDFLKLFGSGKVLQDSEIVNHLGAPTFREYVGITLS